MEMGNKAVGLTWNLGSWIYINTSQNVFFYWFSISFISSTYKFQNFSPTPCSSLCFAVTSALLYLISEISSGWVIIFQESFGRNSSCRRDLKYVIWGLFQIWRDWLCYYFCFSSLHTCVSCFFQPRLLGNKELGIIMIVLHQAVISFPFQFKWLWTLLELYKGNNWGRGWCSDYLKPSIISVEGSSHCVWGLHAFSKLSLY